MVLVSAAVEDHGLDAGRLGALGDGLADGLASRSALVAGAAGQRRFRGRGGGQRAPGRVVDHLRVDVLGAAEDGQARTLRGAGDRRADAVVALAHAAASRDALLHQWSDFGRLAALPALPALRRIRSPA